MCLNRVLTCVTAVALATMSPAWATIIVSIEPAAQSVDILAASVSVDIVADIPQEDAIVHWGIDLQFDDTVVNLLGDDWLAAVTINDSSFDPVVATDGDALSALVPFAESPLWGDDILLATVEFVPVALGTSMVTLSDDNGTGDLTEGFALNPPPVGAFADVTYVSGEIAVTPEPAALAFLLVGTVALLRRR